MSLISVTWQILLLYPISIIMLLQQFLIAQLIAHNLIQLPCKSPCISLHWIRRDPFQMHRNPNNVLNLISISIYLPSKNFKNSKTSIYLFMSHSQREPFPMRWQWNLCPLQFKFIHLRTQLHHSILLI